MAKKKISCSDGLQGHADLRPFWSIWYLMLRSTAGKGALLFLLTLALQGGALYLSVRHELLIFQAGVGTISPPEEILSHALCGWIAALGLIGLSIVLSSFGTKQTASHLLLRLRVEEKSIFWLHTVYNFVWYLLFYVMQLLGMLAFCYYMQKQLPQSFWTEQSLFLTWHRNHYLYSLFPFGEITRHARNVCLAFSAATCAAGFSCRRRRGLLGLNIVAMLCIILVFFVRDAGHGVMDVMVIALCAANLAELTLFIYRKEQPDYGYLRPKS